MSEEEVQVAVVAQNRPPLPTTIIMYILPMISCKSVNYFIFQIVDGRRRRVRGELWECGWAPSSSSDRRRGYGSRFLQRGLHFISYSACIFVTFERSRGTSPLLLVTRRSRGSSSSTPTRRSSAPSMPQSLTQPNTLYKTMFFHFLAPHPHFIAHKRKLM